MRSFLVAAATVLFLSGAARVAEAGTFITDPSGQYTVSIGTLGNLEPGDSVYQVFQRIADGYDPIIPGTPREAWGVSASGFGGFADTFAFGSANLVNNGAPIYNPNSAFISTFLNNGVNLLQIDQSFSFVAPNVLAIQVTITNVTGAAQGVLYSRNVDWDMPISFDNISTVDPLVAPVASSSFYGFENPDPTIPFGFDAGPGGGSFGPSDLGGGLNANLGVLGAGASTTFEVYHALNVIGQTEALLRSQLNALGANFVITAVDPADPTGATYSAGLAFAPTSAVPEPTSLVIVGSMAIFGLAFGATRRRGRVS